MQTPHSKFNIMAVAFAKLIQIQKLGITVNIHHSRDYAGTKYIYNQRYNAGIRFTDSLKKKIHKGLRFDHIPDFFIFFLRCNIEAVAFR
jgi:hypothetical protein